ncbi:MAG: copper chaperone PCu(A)C [Hyphomicrobiales bacterium]|nr:copper chaperone PCu(A)C [Hyphomicrobiales bacterium]
MKRELLNAVFGCIFTLAACRAASAGDIALEHVWARATPPAAPVGGAYLTIRNNGASADKLVGATADAADHVEIHEMKMENGVMKMRQIQGLDIPAHGAVQLKPGGYHLMFEGLKRPLKVGEAVKGSVTFEKGGSMPVEFKVEAMGAMPDKMHDMKHDQMR